MKNNIIKISLPPHKTANTDLDCDRCGKPLSLATVSKASTYLEQTIIVSGIQVYTCKECANKYGSSYIYWPSAEMDLVLSEVRQAVADAQNNAQ